MVFFLLGFFCGLPLTQAAYLDVDFRNTSTKNISDYRVDMCDRAHGLINGNYTIDTVLEGLELSFLTPQVISPMGMAFFHEDEDGKQTGLHVDLMDAIAKDAGFTYTMYYCNTSSFEPELSSTEFFFEASNYFDLVVDWGMQTSERAVMGLVNPGSFLDLSIVTAGIKEVETHTTFREILTSFLDPFTSLLWLLIIAVVLVTSFIYAIIERDNELEFETGESLVTRIIHAMSVGFSQLCGAAMYVPKTMLGKAVAVSYSFFCLLVVASYTANLATFLLNNIFSEVSCHSIEDCLAKKKSFCVYKGGALEEYIHSQYPSAVKENLIKSIEDGDTFISMRQGTCDNVISTHMELDLASVDKSSNSDCKLSRLSGESEANILGGWIGQVDYQQMCTSVLIDSFRYRVLQLAKEGTIDDEYEEFLEDSRSMEPCSATEELSSNDVPPLDVENLAGWVVIHTFVLVISISYSIFIWRKHQTRERQKCDLSSKEKAHAQEEETRSSQLETNVELILNLVQQYQLHLEGDGVDKNSLCFPQRGVSPPMN